MINKREIIILREVLFILVTELSPSNKTKIFVLDQYVFQYSACVPEKNLDARLYCNHINIKHFCSIPTL